MKIVKIIWWDSKGVTSDWEFKDELKELHPVHIESVGFLLEENGDYLTILQSDSEEQILGRLTIPKGCVCDVQFLVKAEVCS